MTMIMSRCRRRLNPNRRRKHIPYGSKGYCGYGGATYSRKYGEFMMDIVDKSSYRQKVKQLLQRIKNEF